ncbi:hypothetical protein HNY73_010046 [Argiope bruennichi]|uniref:Uncharacterized protein n=1 Tax=Argiope bruennichi TaxID=94029 RepID=A0A8T0F228_ARGBR|nr:hypothetical protein HNY73_010046 [Argiope bruennichi]
MCPIENNPTNSQSADKPRTENRTNGPIEAVGNTAVYKRDFLFAELSELLMGKKANHKFRLNDNERVKAFALLSDLRNLLREKEEKEAEEESIAKEKAKPAKTYAEATATKQAHTVLLLPKENSKENF